MPNEDGVNSGARNIGRLALALIPWALGIGFAVWLGVYVALHQFRHDVEQENRAATYVSATDRPKSKISIEVIPHDCSHVARADLDGTRLLLYATNDCKHRDIDYFSWHWQTLSPDGTIIGAGYTNLCPNPRARGEKAECELRVESDDRTKTLRVWTSVTTD